MPNCKKCNNDFPFRIRINGKVRNLGSRKYCLDCSPFGSGNTKKLEVDPMPDKKFCSWCSETKSKSEFYIRADRVGLSHYCKTCSNIQNRGCQNKRAESRKLKLISLKGGGCQRCEYKSNSAALTFHHSDPKTKVFGLTIPNLRNRSWKECVNEANKCELLCANCHAEEHNPQCNLND